MIEKKSGIGNTKSKGSYKMMNLNDIVVHDEFSDIFPIHEQVLAKIKDSILEKGFDRGEPIAVWETEEKKYVLVDGHTRKKAAEEAGLKEIPVSIMHFDSLKEAKTYAVYRQVNRRNIDQAEFFKAVQLYVNKRKRDGTGRSVELLSKELGVSPSTIVHAKAVAAKASKEDIDAIKKGEMTINKVYQKIKKEKPKKERKKISGIKKQEKQLATNLVNIEDVLKLLNEHNETSAINVILKEYQNLEA